MLLLVEVGYDYDWTKGRCSLIFNSAVAHNKVGASSAAIIKFDPVANLDL